MRLHEHPSGPSGGFLKTPGQRKRGRARSGGSFGPPTRKDSLGQLSFRRAPPDEGGTSFLRSGRYYVEEVVGLPPPSARGGGVYVRSPPQGRGDSIDSEFISDSCRRKEEVQKGGRRRFRRGGRDLELREIARRSPFFFERG